MADQEEVVILDADGTEHVFPAGFDPQRAAAIVRGQKVPAVAAPPERTPLPTATPPAPVLGRGSNLNLQQSRDFSKGVVANAASTVFEGGDAIRRLFGMERVIERPEVKAAITAPDNTAGRAGGYFETALEMAAPTRGLAWAASKLPTRAKAGQKFAQVMSKVGDEAVETAGISDPALRVAQLADRGSSMPQAVRKLLMRATDPGKGDINYREMRDFYSNISRLSADEAKRLTPQMKRQIGELRAAMDKVLEQTAAKGGADQAYREAMREYAMASKIRELAVVLGKWGAGAAGAASVYQLGQSVLD